MSVWKDTLHELISWWHSQFQQIYIFTLLAMLYYFIVHVIATGEFDLKPEVESLLNQGSGGIIAMMTMIVQSIFNKSSGRSRQSDVTGAPTDPAAAKTP